MARRLDWNQIAEERKSGISAPELAKKYRVKVGVIYNHTRQSGAVRLRARNNNGKLVHSATSNTMFADVVQLLQSKKEKIDRVIQELNAEA